MGNPQTEDQVKAVDIYLQQAKRRRYTKRSLIIHEGDAADSID